MPRKIEHKSEDPKYPDIVLVIPAWGEVSRERRRSTNQLIERKALNIFLQDDEARQKYLSPYWIPKNQGVKKTKNTNSKQNVPSFIPSTLSSNSISNSRASICSSPNLEGIDGQSQQEGRRDDPSV